MTKFLKKVFLYGILLSCVNYELVYSAEKPILDEEGTKLILEKENEKIEKQPPKKDYEETEKALEPEFEPKLVKSSNPGQFNITVDLENNIGSINNKLDSDMEIKWNQTIGSYDTDKYEIKDNALYNKGEKVFCKLDKNAGDYGIFKKKQTMMRPLQDLDVPYTTKMTHTDGKDYYVFPICDNYYKFISDTNIVNMVIQNTQDQILTTKDGNKIYIGNLMNNNNITFQGSSVPYVGDIATTTVRECNIMCVKIGDIYKLSEDNTKILQCKFPLYKYITNDSDTTMKWYKTDETGKLPGDTADYTELNRTIFTITPNGKLTLSKPDSSGEISLVVSNFGKLINNGKLILNDKTSILSPKIILGNETNQWNKSISNLDDVAIDNSNGTIVLKSGSTIDNINKSDDSDPITQGGTVDISDLVDWTNNEVTEKDGKPNLNIKSAFYNVNIKLIPEIIANTSNLITYFNNDTNFSGDSKYFFKNMKFFSDVKDSDGKVTEARHSTISMQSGVLLLTEPEVNKTKYNTEKQVILKSNFNTNNVLKLFYKTSDITDEFIANPTLVIESTEANISLYELLSDPTLYINNILVKENNKELSENYGLDLIPFIKENVIDYSKFDENGNTNLEKIQFVSDKYKTNNLDLTLYPSYVMDGEIKVEDTTIDMKSTYDGWKGVINPNSDKIKLSTGTYIIKASNYLSIETVGDVKLYFDNKDQLNLCELSNSNGTLSVFQNNFTGNNPLIIKLASDNYSTIPNNVTFNINAPVSVQFVKSNVMFTKKVYKEIKDLINYYVKAKVTYESLGDNTVEGATDDIKAKYEAISDSSNGVESKLAKINEFLTEIEDITSETYYAEYFKKIDENGTIPSDDYAKKYSEIKNVQKKLIKINRFKLEVLEDYLKVLTHYLSILPGEDTQKTTVQNKIDEIKQNISTTTANQLKMLKNKYFITSKCLVHNTNIMTLLSKEISDLSGEPFPSFDAELSEETYNSAV